MCKLWYSWQFREKMLELNKAKIRNQSYIEVTGDEQPTGEYNWRKADAALV